jgi:tetratricopeptide (TPR) repeat protein
LARLGTSAARKALERARTKQPPYLRRVIGDVLAQKPPQLPPKSPEGALVPEQWPDLFIAAGDILIVESDWYFHKGDYDQAIRANEADVFLDPQNVDAWTNAAWLTWSMNRDEEADKLYEACIAAKPKEYDAYFQYGMFRNARKRLAEAAELMKRACACEGAPVTVFRMCGHTLEAAGRTAEARQWWQEAAKKFPDDPVIKRKVDETKRETRGTEGIVSDA